MGWLRFLRRRAWDDERARELEDYLARETAENVARGMTREAASRAAHLRLGNATRIREEIYEMNTLGFVESAWQDLRYGLRLLRRNPTFALVAVLTLALGTGANAAIFQLVDAVRLRTLPIDRPEELVSVGIDTHGKGRTGRRFAGRSNFTEPVFHALSRDQQVFSTLIAWGTDTWDLSTEGEARPVRGLYVSGSYFDGLHVRPAAGRLLAAGDDHPGCGAAGAVLSYGFWQSQYGGNPGAVGQTISLNHRPIPIIGVAQAGFFGVDVGRTFDVAVPLCADPILRGEDFAYGKPHAWWLDIMGRLKPGVSLSAARTQLAAISPSIFRTTVPPGWNATTQKEFQAFTFTATAAPTGVSSARGEYAAPLWILLGATGLVLVMACANLANLMLARATARDREMAVRLAIGASRRRLVRQMLSESVLIAGAGAVGGLLAASWLSRALVAFLNGESGHMFVDLSADWRVFAFVTMIGVFACLLFGLSPALKATATSPAQSMQAGGRTGADAHGAFALRRGLVVLQIALSLVLVVGALLFTRTLRNLTSVDLGFRQDGIVAARVDIRRTAIPAQARYRAIQDVLEHVRSVPGVRSAAEALIVPLEGSVWNGRIVVGGALQDGMVLFNQVGGDYFQTLQVPLIAGRTFDSRDRVGTPLAAVVNEAFVQKYLPNVAPVGQVFHNEPNPGAPNPDYLIVGVVKNTIYEDLRERYQPIAYLALSQERDIFPLFTVVLRADAPPSMMTAAITHAILEGAPGSAITYRTIQGYVRDATVTERLMAVLSASFGVLALLIAAVGLYGVMSYAVSRRKVEIGIRVALGAAPASVVRMVLLESGVLLAVGIAAGAVLAGVAARWASTLLYGLSASDPFSFGAAISCLALVTLLGAWIPAHRASKLEPTVALREG